MRYFIDGNEYYTSINDGKLTVRQPGIDAVNKYDLEDFDVVYKTAKLTKNELDVLEEYYREFILDTIKYQNNSLYKVIFSFAVENYLNKTNFITVYGDYFDEDKSKILCYYYLDGQKKEYAVSNASDQLPLPILTNTDYNTYKIISSNRPSIFK